MTGARRHDATGRSTGIAADKRWRQANKPNGRFGWLPLDLLNSPAWIALSSTAQRVVMRILVEHINQGGQENGRLRVTFSNFEAYGIRRMSLVSAIDEAQRAGFILRVDPGRKAWGEYKGRPAAFRLTWLPVKDEAQGISPPTNEWKKFQSLEEARAALETSPKRNSSSSETLPIPVAKRYR